MLFVHVTSRVDGEPQPTLLRDKGFTSFPSLCFMDADGEVMVRQGERTVTAFAATLRQLRTVRDLRRLQQIKSDPDVARRLLLLEVELGMLPPEQIEQRLVGLELAEDDRARLDMFRVDAELLQLRSRARQLGSDGVGAAVAAIARAGRRPSAAQARLFWQLVIGQAAQVGDAALAQAAFEELSALQLPATLRRRIEVLLEQAQRAAAGKGG